ncbi:DNRLRE domain-containing protein [Aliiroseovarius sp. YM-037]|uniref:DNRLRE domain-containing protein n=1 Tax=Aliiroseovarius sp. YM-037 TaxID=3341728 RepID=UPI003A80D318
MIKTPRFILILMCGAILAGCAILSGPFSLRPTLTPTMEGSAQGQYAYLWLGATKDADVRCSAPACADEDVNYGGQFSLNLGAGPSVPPGLHRTYVEFYLPLLPDDVEIVEAHINLFEDSQQLPSPRQRGIVEVIAEWDPMAITHANQPMTVGSLTKIGFIGGFQQRGEWRGTIPARTDLLPAIRGHLSDPATNHGFIVQNVPRGGPNYLRSFSSLNELSRTETALGQSPRLLLKLRFKEGEGFLDDTNLALPALPPDTDLDEQLTGPNVLMVRIAGGADWPVSWDVAFD